MPVAAVASPTSTETRWPRWWRVGLLALGTLILCSCRSPMPDAGPLGPSVEHGKHASYNPSRAVPSAAACEASVAMPPEFPGATDWPGAEVAVPWRPPGIAGPWPRDEYLHDGGDSGLPVYVDDDWGIHNLELEDTVAHFDTLDGQRLVQPSNRVDLYAPRFAAVRSVTGPLLNEQVLALEGVDAPTRAVRHEDLQFATSSQQHLQAIGEVGRKRASAYLMGEGDGVVASTLTPLGFEASYLPFEDLSIIRHGEFAQADKAWLSQGAEAAYAWSADQAVQVIIDRQAATEFAGDRAVQTIFVADEIPTRPLLRVVKVASQQSAQPGEEVDFTIRYDNIGTAVIGNVTIVDNLTTRLEYVPNSAQSSLPAEFFTDPNQGDSLVLRWEIGPALEPGQGGVVRFRCRVR